MQCYNAVIQHLILKVDTTNTETVTRSERHEEDAFLDEVMNSDVMKETMRWDICNSRLSQVSCSEAALHKVSNGVQKAAERVLVHSLQQGKQDSGLKVGTSFSSIYETTITAGLSMCSWARRSLGKFR